MIPADKLTDMVRMVNKGVWIARRTDPQTAVLVPAPAFNETWSIANGGGVTEVWLRTADVMPHATVPYDAWNVQDYKLTVYPQFSEQAVSTVHTLAHTLGRDPERYRQGDAMHNRTLAFLNTPFQAVVTPHVLVVGNMNKALFTITDRGVFYRESTGLAQIRKPYEEYYQLPGVRYIPPSNGEFGEFRIHLATLSVPNDIFGEKRGSMPTVFEKYLTVRFCSTSPNDIGSSVPCTLGEPHRRSFDSQSVRDRIVNVSIDLEMKN